MEVRIVLTLLLFANVWLANGCIPNNAVNNAVNRCSHGEKCYIRNNDYKGERISIRKTGTHYSITLGDADPCSFKTYDTDGDGVITMGEFHSLLGKNGVIGDLFSDINIETDDKVIKPDEFYTKTPLIITECFDSDK